MMSYTVLGERDARFQPRKGLEGPFYFGNGRVLYYDTKDGNYWDPLTDFYVDREEVNQLHEYMAKILSR
jgi:hypothetical protein